MTAVEYQFPALSITLEDVVSTFAGVRPVIGTGKLNPSEESRDHVIWEENGLITVTGGKLTTFRLIALDTLKAIRQRIPDMPEPEHDMPVLNQVNHHIPGCEKIGEACRKRILGRLGADALSMVDAAQAGEMENIPGTSTLWAEVRWAARDEGVCHLDDLLLRRTRLGLVLPDGARAILPRVKQICMAELGWSEAQWQEEEAEYLKLWSQCYSLPPQETIPDWKTAIQEAKARRIQRIENRRREMKRRSTVALVIITLTAAVTTLVWFHRRQAQE